MSEIDLQQPYPEPVVLEFEKTDDMIKLTITNNLSNTRQAFRISRKEAGRIRTQLNKVIGRAKKEKSS